MFDFLSICFYSNAIQIAIIICCDVFPLQKKYDKLFIK